MKFLIKDFFNKCTGGSRTAATSKVEHFVIIVITITIITKNNYYYKELRLVGCISPRSASEI